MIRRRPIPHSHVYPESSLRYTVSPDGSFRTYPDGREVCNDSPAGWREYSRRIDAMLQRQGWVCSLCGKKIRARQDATFEHQRRRGMGSAWRQDAIRDKDGNPINNAAHWTCNGEKG